MKYKVACLVHRSSSGLAPAWHILDDMNLFADSSNGSLIISRQDIMSSDVHNTISGKSFDAAGPRVWNNLPPYLQQDISYGQCSNDN